MAILTGNKKAKLYVGNEKVKKVFAGDKMVYSAGNVCTYHVDGVTYQEEVDDGESCLSPASFTPQKDGWEFLGWRDTQTAGDALADKVMGDEPVDLYAMFKYPNKAAALKNVDWNNPSWPEAKVVLTVDYDKYGAFSIMHGYLHLRVNFAAGRMAMGITGQSKSHALWGETTYGGKETVSNLAGRYLSFGNERGVNSLWVDFNIYDNSTIGGRTEDITGTLIGRTTVG